MKKICPFWHEFLLLPIKSKLGVTFLLFFCFIVGLLVSFSYWRIVLPPSVQTALEKAPFVPKEEKPTLASLALVPEKQSVKTNQSFSVTINLRTGDYKVDTIDAVLKFDPKVLKVEKVSEGMFFAEYPVKRWKDDKVYLTGTIGISGKQAGGTKGEGPFGTVTFKALSTGSAIVNFDQSSLVVAKGENVLGETKGASFEIY